MEFFCGLDVGMDQTAICVVDDKGDVLLEVALVTEPDAIKSALSPYRGRLRRAGHEAGALSPWLHPELLHLGLPAICVEPQHVAPRCMPSATRPTVRMRSASPTSCAPADSGARISGPRRAIGCG